MRRIALLLAILSAPAWANENVLVTWTNATNRDDVTAENPTGTPINPWEFEKHVVTLTNTVTTDSQIIEITEASIQQALFLDVSTGTYQASVLHHLTDGSTSDAAGGVSVVFTILGGAQSPAGVGVLVERETQNTVTTIERFEPLP